jgi:hypothetical protein
VKGLKGAAPNESSSLGGGMLFSALRWRVDVAELLWLNLRNPAVERSYWKIGYRQVSFGFIKRERLCIRELQSTELDISLGQDSRTIFLNNGLWVLRKEVVNSAWAG